MANRVLYSTKRNADNPTLFDITLHDGRVVTARPWSDVEKTKQHYYPAK